MSINDEPEYLFYADFSDGYSFRNLVEYLKNTNITGNLAFKKDGIFYEQHNNSTTLLNAIEIRGYDLSAYIYNSNSEVINVGVNLANFRSITKSVGKKDSIRLYMVIDNPMLYISISSPNTKELNRNNVSVIRPQKLDVTGYTFPEYDRTETNPNCTAPSFDFNKMCMAMHSIKCNQVKIYSEGNNIIFKGMFDGDIVGRIDTFGVNKRNHTSIADIEASYYILIETSTIKALGKLNNLSPNGTIKMYLEEDRPFKIISNVGSYGKLTIYLRDIRGDSTEE